MGLISGHCPQSLLDTLRPIAEEVINEVAEQDAFCRKAFESYSAFAKTYGAWTERSEAAYWKRLK